MVNKEPKIPEELKKKFEKVSSYCNKTKSMTLRIKMDVILHPVSFEILLKDCWEKSSYDVFKADCNGKLLNPEVCGKMADEAQIYIDDVMGNLCEQVVDMDVGLHKQIEGFVEEWNVFLKEFYAEAGKFYLMPSDIVKANTKKGKK